MISVLPYSLPDIQLLESEVNQSFVWIPQETYIVLGASNNVHDAVIAETVAADNIPVLKRKSGGQTVMLTPRNVIISAIITDEEINKPLHVFQEFNKLIINTLQKSGVEELSTRGISDIAVGDKKILGSSIYRAKTKLFYHAVLNYGEPPGTFAKYLKHPSKEPDYRVGRTHTEFVTSLREIGYCNSILQLQNDLREALSQNKKTPK